MNSIVPVEQVPEKLPKVGRPSDYDEFFHIKLLYDTFLNDEGIVAFCADANISIKTFHNWLKKHKNFNEAYNRFLPKGARISERKAVNADKNFNFTSWKFIHMNRYGKLYQSFPKIKDKSVEGKCNATWKALENGYLTPQEYNQIMGGIGSQMELERKAKEVDLENKPKIDFSNTPDEAIRVYMAVIEGKKVRVED